MPEMLFDGRAVSFAPGTTLLEAAGLAGIAVPSLCRGEGLPHHESCMVCLVEDLDSGRLVPSCATPAAPGARVSTGGARVLAARRRAVEFLLAEHAGDCDAPCVRACPAHADIPGMARRLGRGDWEGALAALHARLPLAGSLARVCPAPCERACRRGRLDGALRIREMKRALCDWAAEDGAAGLPTQGAGEGRAVVVVGAGPAGLSAASFLARGGCRCTVIDGRPRPGGALRSEVPSDTLHREVLEADIEAIARLGVRFIPGVTVQPGKDLEELRGQYDAVALAVGSRESLAGLLGEEAAVEPATGACPLPGVLVGGNALREPPSRMAVRGVADGRNLAGAVLGFLQGRPPSPPRRRYDSRRGELGASELALLAAEAGSRAARRREGLVPADEAEAEALRCLDCGCARERSCGLRRAAVETGADGRLFPGGAPAPFERVRGRGGLSFEPGKCIRCGLCVRIARRGGDRPGLAFTGRGSGVRVRAPFGADIGEALPSTAAECVARCPTGALAWDP